MPPARCVQNLVRILTKRGSGLLARVGCDDDRAVEEFATPGKATCNDQGWSRQ